MALFKSTIMPMDRKFRAVLEAKELKYTTKHAQVLAFSLCSIPFPFAPHYVDIMSVLSYFPNIINKIGSEYGYLPFGGKYAIHCQLVKVEM